MVADRVVGDLDDALLLLGHGIDPALDDFATLQVLVVGHLAGHPIVAAIGLGDQAADVVTLHAQNGHRL